MIKIFKVVLLIFICFIFLPESKGQLTNMIQIGKTAFFFPDGEMGFNELISVHYSQKLKEKNVFYRFGMDSYLKNFPDLEIGALRKRNFLSLQGGIGANLLKGEEQKNIFRIGIGPSFRIGGETTVAGIDGATNQVSTDVESYQDIGVNFFTEYIIFPVKRFGIGVELNYQQYFKLTKAHPAIRVQLCYRFSNPEYQNK